MVCFGMVIWYGAVYGMAWYDMVWCGAVYGVVRYGTVLVL